MWSWNLYNQIFYLQNQNLKEIIQNLSKSKDDRWEKTFVGVIFFFTDSLLIFHNSSVSLVLGIFNFLCGVEFARPMSGSGRVRHVIVRDLLHKSSRMGRARNTGQPWIPHLRVDYTTARPYKPITAPKNCRPGLDHGTWPWQIIQLIKILKKQLCINKTFKKQGLEII